MNSLLMELQSRVKNCETGVAAMKDGGIAGYSDEESDFQEKQSDGITEGDGVNIGHTSQRTLDKSKSKALSKKSLDKLSKKSPTLRKSTHHTRVSQEALEGQEAKLDDMKNIIEDLRK